MCHEVSQLQNAAKFIGNGNLNPDLLCKHTGDHNSRYSLCLSGTFEPRNISIKNFNYLTFYFYYNIMRFIRIEIC